jgi:hypothetical protein
VTRDTDKAGGLAKASVTIIEHGRPVDYAEYHASRTRRAAEQGPLEAKTAEQRKESVLDRLSKWNGVLAFIALLAIWAAGSWVLAVLSILSISVPIITAMAVLAGVCLVLALLLFFLGWRKAAFRFAAGPAIVVGCLVALSLAANFFLIFAVILR